MTVRVKRMALVLALLFGSLFAVAVVNSATQNNAENGAARTACRAIYHYNYIGGQKILVWVEPWHPPYICIPY
jgi:hypothetical protein